MRLFKLIIQSLAYGMIGGVIALLAIDYIFPIVNNPKAEKDIETQISQLNEMQKSLKELQNFITLQKGKLQSESAALSDIRKEKEKLEPIVNADRKTIQSIIEFQENKYRGQVWKERSIGFIIGFISSLLASFVIVWINRKKVLPEKEN